MRARLRGALVDAMKARDSVAVSALRSALAAIENSEAVDASAGLPAGVGHADAGSVVGLGAGEADVLSRQLAEDSAADPAGG